MIRAAFLRHSICATVAIAAVACDDSNTSPRDAATDGSVDEAGAGIDVLLSPRSIDFNASGCVPGMEPGFESSCSGPAPLKITFLPAASGSVDSFLWLFGDNTQSSDTIASHTFSLPGRYDVVLVGGDRAGSVFRARPGYINVLPNPLGGPCDVSAQCASDLQCYCGSSDTCSAEFTAGFCSKPCASNCAEGACVDLSLSGQADETSPWRTALCLATCTANSGCTGNLRCRELPGRSVPTPWVNACFAERPTGAGSRCRGSNGLLQQNACLTGLCEDLGAYGLCTPSCADGACPANTACATLAGGSRRCIPRCGTAFACNQDPLLACVPEGIAGPRGFAVDGAAKDERFCMPKTCTDDASCAPSGRCERVNNGPGNCVIR
jgi:PKD repeat protein